MEPGGAARHGRTAVSGDIGIEGGRMKTIRIYPGGGGWFYEVWTASRVVIFGWCATRERATWKAVAA
jgi:hypothetical protein